ncbi:MAG: hypothetical protein PVS3B1_26940 [Ktedonobacteraceae bacterium]
MQQKPEHFGTYYAEAFKDRQVVDSYVSTTRPATWSWRLHNLFVCTSLVAGLLQTGFKPLIA